MKFIRENIKQWKVYKKVEDTVWNLETMKREKCAPFTVYLDYNGYMDNEEEDNFIFSASIKIIDMYRGRSAAGFTVKDKDGTQYTMRLKETLRLFEALHKKDIYIDSKGYIVGVFTFVKQGNNYSLSLYEESL